MDPPTDDIMAGKMGKIAAAPGPGIAVAILLVGQWLTDILRGLRHEQRCVFTTRAAEWMSCVFSLSLKAGCRSRRVTPLYVILLLSDCSI